MRYHYDEPTIKTSMYGVTYKCDHPVYFYCTLFKIGEKGLAVIQQKYDKTTKHTFWGPIIDYMADKIYLHEKFYGYFLKHAAEPVNDLYPTVTIRQIMWALRMKPLKREPWETYFDRHAI